MADDDSNEIEHGHRLWWDVRRVVVPSEIVLEFAWRDLR
jgi:hypothetical protein